jgi:hypothetical protein
MHGPLFFLWGLSLDSYSSTMGKPSDKGRPFTPPFTLSNETPINITNWAVLFSASPGNTTHEHVPKKVTRAGWGPQEGTTLYPSALGWGEVALFDFLSVWQTYFDSFYQIDVDLYLMAEVQFLRSFQQGIDVEVKPLSAGLIQPSSHALFLLLSYLPLP